MELLSIILLYIIYHLAVGDDGVVPAGPHGGAHVALASKLGALALLDHTGASTLSAQGASYNEPL